MKTKRKTFLAALTAFVAAPFARGKSEEKWSEDTWKERAKYHRINERFYCDIGRRTGELLGPEVYVSDCGRVSKEVIAHKVPMVLEERLRKLRNLRNFAKDIKGVGWREYPAGSFNGLKQALAIMEGREPEYQDRSKEEPGEKQWPFSRRHALAERVEGEFVETERGKSFRVNRGPLNTIGVLARLGWMRDESVK